MHSYFISDLHLTPGRPDLISAFTHFIADQAHTAEQVFILGDLFEYWIGDDAASIIGAEPILDLMHQLSQRTQCWFMAGNRDFLVRQTFSERTGFTILPDETVIDLYGTPTLLLHGDSLCTDDIAHQQFRQTMMTNKPFCDHFLSLPIDQRIEQAKQARMESGKHKAGVSDEIMDVNDASVENAFERHGVSQMIHGHTHRQNTHNHQGGTRYVLGDWDTTNSVLTASDNGINIHNSPI